MVPGVPLSGLRAALLSLGLVLGGLSHAEPVRPLRFARGATEIVVSDAVVRGSRHVYSFQAQKGQRATISIEAVENNAAFSLWRPDAKVTFGSYVEFEGRTLARAGETDDARRWRGQLPESGTYLIGVGPTRGNATYELRVQISALARAAGERRDDDRETGAAESSRLAAPERQRPAASPPRGAAPR
jgi:hypothetical protein